MNYTLFSDGLLSELLRIFKNNLYTIPYLFCCNAFLMLSNGEEAKVGTPGSKYEFFHLWKWPAESDPGSVAPETMLRGICEKKNFLEVLENREILCTSVPRSGAALSQLSDSFP